jgi:TonB family protein
MNDQPRSTRVLVLTVALAFAFLAGYQVHRWLAPPMHLTVLGHEILRAEAPKVPVQDHDHATAPTETPTASREPFVVVEQMPELIGGLASVQEQLRYPELARKAGIEGRIIVQFVVDEAGRVQQPRIVRGLGAGLDAEALRVVRQVRFTPGHQRGEAVQVKMSLPITFRLPHRS